MLSRSSSRGLLLVTVAVGAALRLYHLGGESLWFDEAYSIQLARGTLAHILGERTTDIHPPLYYVALHVWMLAAGHSEAAARLLSALCSIATIPAAALVARRLFNQPVALVTAAIVAISPFHVEFAQEARMYALLCLTATLSVGAFVTLFDFERSERRPWRITYVLATTLMLYTHIYSVFIVAAEVVSLGVIWRIDRDAFRRVLGPWLRLTAVVGVLYLPWLTSLADQVSRVQGSFWIARPMLVSVLFPFAAFTGWFPAVVLVPLAGYGLKRLFAATGARPPVVFVAPWLAAPIVLPFLLSFVGSPIFHYKYTIAASVPFAMVAAVGFLEWPNAKWRQPLAAVLMAITAGRLAYYYTVPHKDGWRRAAATIEAAAQPNDVVLFYPWFNQIPYDYYRQRDDVRPLPLIPDIETPLPDEAAIPSIVADATRSRDRLWLVLQQGIMRRSEILEELGRTMRQSQHIAAEHVELFLFQK